MSIVITPPPTAVPVTPALNVGGSLDASTLYEFVLSVKNTSAYTAGSSTYLRSIPSFNDINTTVTEKSITLTWTLKAGFYYYMIAYRKGGAGAWKSLTDNISQYTHYANTQGLCTFTFDNEAAYPTGQVQAGGYNFQHYEIVQDPFPIKKDLGTGCITITGDGGDVYPQDIKDAVDAAGWNDYFLWDGATIHTSMHIQSVIGTGGQIILNKLSHYGYSVSIFSANGNRVYLNWAKIMLVSYGVRFNSDYMGLIHAVMQLGGYGGIELQEYILSGNAYITARSTATFDNMKVNGLEIQAYTGTELIGVKSDYQVRANEVDITGTNPLKIIDCEGSRYLPLYAQDCTDTGIDVIEVRNFVVYSTTGYDLWSYWAITKEIKVYDFKGMVGYTLNGSFDKPVVRWQVTGMANLILLYHNIDITVLDTDGDIIVGATVTIKDKDGNTLFSDDTDANGNIADDILTTTVEWDSVSGGTYDSTYIHKNPLTISISKSGHKTYIGIHTIEEKTDWEIVLQPPETVIHNSELYGATIY